LNRCDPRMNAFLLVIELTRCFSLKKEGFMNYSKLLQYQGYIYLNSIFEPEDNALIVDIERCKISGNVAEEKAIFLLMPLLMWITHFL
jgi:adenine-specific DNA methylase